MEVVRVDLLDRVVAVGGISAPISARSGSVQRAHAPVRSPPRAPPRSAPRGRRGSRDRSEAQRRVGPDDAQRPARPRLHRSDDEHHPAREQAVRVRGDREEVKVVRARCTARAELAERLLLGREAVAADSASRDRSRSEPANSSSTSGWSWRLRPTPGRSTTTSIPAASRSAGHRFPSAGGSPANRRHPHRAPPSLPRSAVPSLPPTLQRVPAPSPTRNGRVDDREVRTQRAGSRYANAALNRTPLSMFAGAVPNPTRRRDRRGRRPGGPRSPMPPRGRAVKGPHLLIAVRPNPEAFERTGGERPEAGEPEAVAGHRGPRVIVAGHPTAATQPLCDEHRRALGPAPRRWARVATAPLPYPQSWDVASAPASRRSEGPTGPESRSPARPRRGHVTRSRPPAVRRRRTPTPAAEDEGVTSDSGRHRAEYRTSGRTFSASALIRRREGTPARRAVYKALVGPTSRRR